MMGHAWWRAIVCGEASPALNALLLWLAAAKPLLSHNQLAH